MPSQVVLTLIPMVIARVDVPVPRTHAARDESQAAALLALPQPFRCRFKFPRPFRDAGLKVGVELFQLPRLAIKIGEDADLGT